MGKLEGLAGLAGVGLAGTVIYMFASGRWKLPAFSSESETISKLRSEIARWEAGRQEQIEAHIAEYPQYLNPPTQADIAAMPVWQQRSLPPDYAWYQQYQLTPKLLIPGVYQYL